MDLHEALTLAKFDTRLLDRNLIQGIITKADYDSHLKSLPDVSGQSIPIDLTSEEYGNGHAIDQ
jgi:hypothetical protein